MTYTGKHARSGLTAIAAVLAMSSTSIIAQETTTPPDPIAETTEPAADPLAPEPTATEATTAEPAAAETAAPATTTRRTATRTKATTTTTRQASSEPTRTAAPADAAPATEATAEAMPVPPPTGAMVDPGEMPVDETAMAETTVAPADDALPIAGAAGLGLLALGGIGMAVGRRRRRKEELAHMAANREYLDSHPSAGTPTSHAPAFAGVASLAVAAAGPGPVRTDVPRTKLPAGFDLSRFGPHVRAAYQGPTADNPSLSMKHRLRRAAAMDQQARQHDEAPREAAHFAARPDQANKPIWNSRNDGFMLRRAPGKQPSKPAFQH